MLMSNSVLKFLMRKITFVKANYKFNENFRIFK